MIWRGWADGLTTAIARLLAPLRYRRRVCVHTRCFAGSYGFPSKHFGLGAEPIFQIVTVFAARSS